MHKVITGKKQSSENWKSIYLDIQVYHFWAYSQKFPSMPQGHVFHYIHSNLVCDSQKLETTQMSYNRRMNTENVVHLHNQILLSC